MSANAGTTAEMEGGQEAAPEPAFAQPCANAKLLEIQARLEECRRLEPGMLTKMRIVDQTMAASDEAWNAALPDLDKQQKLRSRRGRWQNLAEQAGFETFEDYWERICKENGFKRISLRTVQDRLKKNRDRNRQEPKPKVKRGPSLKRPQQKRLIVAGILGHDLADTVSKTGDEGMKASARIFLAGAPKREQLQQQLKMFSDVQAADAGEHISILVSEAEATPQYEAPEIKSGNFADLTKAIDETFGSAFDECFKGMSAEDIAEKTTMLGHHVLQRYGHRVRGDGKYDGRFSYTPAPPAFHRRWKPKQSVN